MEVSWEELKGKLVSCKLCGQPHELRVSQKGKPYLHCKSWWTNVWPNTKEAKDYILANLIEGKPELSQVKEALVKVEAKPRREAEPVVEDPWEMPVEWE